MGYFLVAGEGVSFGEFLLWHYYIKRMRIGN